MVAFYIKDADTLQSLTKILKRAFTQIGLSWKKLIGYAD